MKLRYLDRCLLLEAKWTLFECCEMFANDPKRTLRTPRCASGSFCSNCVDSVRFDAIDPVFFEPTYIVGLLPAPPSPDPFGRLSWSTSHRVNAAAEKAPPL